MARNLELKARCRSIERAERIARSLGARPAGVLHQVDTYFDVPTGRLKIREVRGDRNELIFYDRPTSTSGDGRWSSYIVYPLSDRPRWLAVLRKTWRVRVVVRKRRTLYLLENARIHLDRVDRLGAFVEFEVVMDRGTAQAVGLYRTLKKAFGLRPQDLIGGSYADMLRPLRRT